MSVAPDTDRRTADGRGRHSRVALIIPALDEEAAIGTVVRAVPRDLADDVIVVDNGSADRTATEARRAGARVVVAVLGTRAVAEVLRWRFGVRLRDLGPFRAIRRNALLALDLREMTYGWPVEMVARAAQAGLRIHEVGVTHRARLAGTSKVAGTVAGSVRAGWRFVRVAMRSW